MYGFEKNKKKKRVACSKNKQLPINECFSTREYCYQWQYTYIFFQIKHSPVDKIFSLHSLYCIPLQGIQLPFAIKKVVKLLQSFIELSYICLTNSLQNKQTNQEIGSFKSVIQTFNSRKQHARMSLSSLKL